VEHERWGSSGPEAVDPLVFVGPRAVISNTVVSLVIIAGTLFTLYRPRTRVRRLQFSLGGLLIGCAVAAALCAFIKYDGFEAPFWRDYNSWSFSFPRGYYFPITASATYLFVPILLGMAMGLYASIMALLRVRKVVWQGIGRAGEPAGATIPERSPFQRTADALLLVAALAAFATAGWCWWERSQPWKVTAVDGLFEGWHAFELTRGFETIVLLDLGDVPENRVPRIGDKIDIHSDRARMNAIGPFIHLRDLDYEILR